MGQTTKTCSKCGAIAEVHFGYHPPRTVLLAWWESFVCGRCGARHELDDYGPLPAPYREIELRDGGYWGLFVKTHDLITISALRTTLGLSLDAARNIKSKRQNPVLIGTEAELNCVASRLTAANVAIELKRGHYDGTLDVASLHF